jgi:hypothetical protein
MIEFYLSIYPYGFNIEHLSMRKDIKIDGAFSQNYESHLNSLTSKPISF